MTARKAGNTQRRDSNTRSGLRDNIKAEFSTRFHQVLDKVPECPPKRGRVAWVAREFKVSAQAALKWLNGDAIPDQTNLAIIAKRVGAEPAWLHSGTAGNRLSVLGDQIADELSEIWDLLPNEAKLQIRSFAQVTSAALQYNAMLHRGAGRAAASAAMLSPRGEARGSTPLQKKI